MSAVSPRSKFRPGSRFGNDAMLEQWPTRRGAPSETCSILVYGATNRGRNSDDSRAHADRGRAGGRPGRAGAAGSRHRVRVRHLRRPHRPHRLGPAQVPELAAHGAGARGVARRRDGRGLWPADAAAWRDDRTGAVGAGQRPDRHDRGVPLQFADAAAHRFLGCDAVPSACALPAGDRRLRQLGCAPRVQRRHQAGDAGA